MNQEEMTRIVKEELRHIPRGTELCMDGYELTTIDVEDTIYLRERQRKKQCHGALMRLEKKVLAGSRNTTLLFLK